MKILKKKLLQQITFSHLSDVDFKDFMTLYKKCAAKPYSFLVIDATLSDVNLLPFRKKSFKNNINIIVRIDKKIRQDKLEYDIKHQ